MDAALRSTKTAAGARRGVTDEKPNPKEAAVAKRTIQYPCYFYGYTWGEVFCDPLLLLVTAFILFVIWTILSSWELNRENLPGILLLLVFFVPPQVFFCMLPFFAGYEDSGPAGSAKKPSSSGSSGGGRARPPQKNPSVASTTEVFVAVRQRQGGSQPARVSISVSID